MHYHRAVRRPLALRSEIIWGVFLCLPTAEAGSHMIPEGSHRSFWLGLHRAAVFEEKAGRRCRNEGGRGAVDPA